MSDPELRKLQGLFRKRLEQKQNVPEPKRGWLGNRAGLVAVPDRPNYVYVKILGEPISEVFNKRVPAISELPVIIGYDPLEPYLRQVLDTVSTPRYGEDTIIGSGLQFHHWIHEWMGVGPGGGDDVVFSQLRQFLPFRLEPVPAASAIVPNWSVWVYRGHIFSSGSGGFWQEYSGNTQYDLTSYRPSQTGKACYVLVTINCYGEVIFTKGAEIAKNSITLTDLPDIPSDTDYVIGAVFLYDGQSAIIEARNSTNILDLRFPMWHKHPAGNGAPMFFVDGALAAAASVGGYYVAPDAGTLGEIWVYVENLGTSGSTTVDINKNGVSILSAPISIAYNDADHEAHATPITITISQGDIFTVDIDAVAVRASGLSVIMAMNGSGSGGGATTFLGLTDTPDTYTGSEDLFVQVNSSGSALQFSPVQIALDDLTDVNAPSPNDDDALTWDSATSKWVPGAVASNVMVYAQVIMTLPGIISAGASPFGVYVYLPSGGGTLTEVKAYLNTPATNTPVHVKLYKNGSSILSGAGYLAIPVGNSTAVTTGFSSTSLTNNDILAIEIAQGDVAASDLSAHVRYTYGASG